MRREYFMSTMNKQRLNARKTGEICCFTLCLACILIAMLMISGCIDQKNLTGTGSSASLTILVDDTSQAEDLRDLAAVYKNQTGKDVVIKEIPADTTVVPGKVTGDLLVSDMSRIPVYADADILTSLNPYLDAGNVVNWTQFERPPLVMVGEFPDQSGTIYALPFSSDALGVAYRTDLFNDPETSDAFCRTQGYPIGLPGTYDELNTLASFFSRQKPGISGIGFASAGGPDPRSSPWLSLVSSYGSGVVDRSQGYASGTWNSSNTRSALLMLDNLSHSEPDGAEKWGDNDVISTFGSGKIAMVITWFSRFSDIYAEAEKNNLSVGFFPLPGQSIKGESYRGVTVKMDGIGIVATGSPERTLDFLTWFYSPQVQLAWAESGHQPSLIPVLDSNEYLSMNLYNRGFPESMRVGVTEIKGRHTSEVRHICEEAVQNFITPVDTTVAEKNLSILDTVASRIDLLQNS